MSSGNSLVNRYSRGEEIANSITHGIGTLLSIGGLVVLAVFASLKGNVWHIVSCSIYGATLIFQYLASTLYHSVTQNKAKLVLRMFDHFAIVLLIAGTYTPFTLVSIHGPWGWSIFGIIWGLAVLGIVLEITPLKRFRIAMVVLYIVMGWVVIVAIRPIFLNLQFLMI